MPCDEHGAFLPAGTPPPPIAQNANNWAPFDNRCQFEFADLIYRRNQMPKTQINDLLDIWRASILSSRSEDQEESLESESDSAGANAPFRDTGHVLATIDAIEVGDVPWQSFVCTPAPDAPADAPDWMKQDFEVWFRDTDLAIQNLLANPDFAGEFDTVPYQEYAEDGTQRYCDIFSADWAWGQAVHINLNAKAICGLTLRTF